MKRRILCLLLVLALCCQLLPAASAAGTAVRAANALYTLGLFQGVGQHRDGSPIYGLDRDLTRQEAVVLLVRLLGREDAALACRADCPFTDLSDWAAPYVRLAWEQGLVRGTAADWLDASAPVTEEAWLLFLLRALGYQDAEAAWPLAQQVGLASEPGGGTFTRGRAAALSLTALGLTCRGSEETLLARLLAAEAVTAEEVADAGLTAALSRRTLSAREVSARCAGAVFYLELYANDVNLRSGTPSASASGFFVTADGVALTNYHAVEGTMFAFAVTNDGSRYPVAGVLFTDPDRDVAVIRVDPTAENTGVTAASFPCLTMRGRDTVVNGDIVYAIGSPLGLSNSISDGIVANRSRQVRTSVDPYIQVTAPISSGSSGGVLLNEYGEAIGITTATFAYGQSLNLAVPLDLAMAVDLTAEGAPYRDYFDAEPSPYADIAMYARYPAVPDFGALVDAELLAEAETTGGWDYIYDNAAANEDALAEYYLAMSEWGFTYAYDRENAEMVFTSQTQGLTIRAGTVEQEDGTAYFRVRITGEMTDTTAMEKNVFPWR